MSLPPLTPQQLVKPRHFELRMSLIFGFLFIAPGVHLPYFPLWLEHNGFGAEHIAVILAAPMFLRVATTPFICALADRAGERAVVLIGLILASVAVSLGYFLPPTYLTVLAVSVVLAFFWTPHSPLADSLAISGVRRFGSDYSRMRIWGSMSFLAASLAGGAILALTGPEAVPVLISGGLTVFLIVSLIAPRLGRPRRPSQLSAADLPKAGRVLTNPAFLLITIGAGFVLASHGFLFAFVSIYWKSIGIGETVSGLLWAFAVFAEAVLYFFFRRLFGSASATRIVVVAGIAAVIRWVTFPLIWPLGLGVPGFFVSQALHAFSTALVTLGVQKMIAETIPEDRTGAAQGVAFFSNGFCMAAITLLSGPLYDWAGIDGLYAMAVLATAGVGLAMLARRSAP